MKRLTCDQQIELIETAMEAMDGKESDREPSFCFAFSCLTKAAKGGSAEAYYCLGIMYFESLHVFFDAEKAEKYLLISALGGYAPAQRDLGFFYYTGIYQVFEKNQEKGERWLKEALAQNDSGTVVYCYYLGACGYEKSLDKALEAVGKCSFNNIINYYQIQHMKNLITYKLSRLRNRDAEDLGYEDLCHYTSTFLYQGSIDSLEIAVCRKNPHAQYIYAGLCRNSELAVRYYMKAAEAGHRGAIRKMNEFWERVKSKAQEVCGES